MKRLKKWTAILMAVIMGVLAPVRTFAADGKYVSDVMVYQAGSFEEAKAGLEGLGYEIVKDSNLNATLSTGVYLGYKTTDNPSEAVTDIAAMNMTGNYSYSDYDELMKKHRNQVMNTICGFETALAEFQTNFANGEPEALMAYDSINVYVNDDNGLRMGDYLLDYDFSADAQKQLTDTIMQANSDIIMSIMQVVSMASDTGDGSLIDRLSACNADKLMEQYLGVYISTAKAQQAIEADFGAAANVLRAHWDLFYKDLLRIETEDFIQNGDGSYTVKEGLIQAEPEALQDTDDVEEAYLQALNTAADVVENEKIVEDITLFVTLYETKYGDSGNLLEFFKRPEETVSDSDLYAAVNAMSEGQRGQLELLGLRAILVGAVIELDADTAEAQDAVTENAEDKELLDTISIFSDVDRSIYEEGVALTGSAVQYQQQSGRNWLAELLDVGLSDTQLEMGIIFSTVAAVGTLAIGIRAARVAMANRASEAGQAILHDIEVQKRLLDGNQEAIKNLKKVGWHDTDSIIRIRKYEIGNIQDKLRQDYREYNELGGSARYVKGVAFILFAVALIADIYFIYEYCTQGEPAEENIPHHLLAAIDTEYGEDYVYYATVKDQNGKAADVNNHEGDKNIGWLVLYETREKNAGKPILAKDLKVQTGSTDVDEDSSFIHLFDRQGALNLTDANYTGVNDSVNGTFVLFSRDANAYAGSAVTGGVLALAAAGGLVLGLGGGYAAGSVIRKKKKAEAV